MKLVQKLSVILAATMIATAVPAITMAASTNRVISGVLPISKGEAATAQIGINFKDYRVGEEEFFIELDGATFNNYVTGEINQENGYVITKVDDKVAKVFAQIAANFENSLIIDIPFVATRDGQVKVKLTANGGKSTITDGEYVIANKSESTASLATSFDQGSYTISNEGTIAPFILKESYVRAFGKEGITLEVELNNKNYRFKDSSAQRIKCEAKYGQSGTVNCTFERDLSNPSKAYITIPASEFYYSTSLVTLALSNLAVEAVTDNLTTGVLTANVRSIKRNGTVGRLDKYYSKLTVANLAGASPEIPDDKIENITGEGEEFNASTSHKVYVYANNSTAEQGVYSAELTWGNMEFNYTGVTNKKWDPETFTYKEEVVQEGQFEARNNSNTVKILNRSNKPIFTSIEFKQNTDLSGAIEGTFTMAGQNSPVDEEETLCLLNEATEGMTVEDADYVEYTLTLNGTCNDTGKVDVGEVVVRLKSEL